MPETLRIEVAWALPHRQSLVALELPAGSTVADAIAASGLRDELPSSLDTGIFGKRCPPEELLGDGDRVEIYRELVFDPKESRRRRAAHAARR